MRCLLLPFVDYVGVVPGRNGRQCAFRTRLCEILTRALTRGLSVELGVELCAEEDRPGGVVQPQQQHDAAGERAVRLRVRIGERGVQREEPAEREPHQRAEHRPGCQPSPPALLGVGREVVDQCEEEQDGDERERPPRDVPDPGEAAAEVRLRRDRVAERPAEDDRGAVFPSRRRPSPRRARARRGAPSRTASSPVAPRRG